MIAPSAATSNPTFLDRARNCSASRCTSASASPEIRRFSTIALEVAAAKTKSPTAFAVSIACRVRGRQLRKWSVHGAQ